jgi:DNA mismatch endonuclease (patch repair protein)
MSNPKLPPGVVSKLSVTKLYGFNLRSIENFVDAGIIVASGTGIVESSLAGLKEGEHYVLCRSCGSHQSAILPKHVKACGGLTVTQYRSRWPDAPLASSFTDKRREKSEDQKQTQSKKLKDRFQTEAGEQTRAEISEASKRMQASGYREKAAAHLRQLNQQPEVRAQRGREAQARWDSGEQRQLIEAYHQDHRDEVLASAMHARGFIQSTFTKPHQRLEQALLDAGLQELQREYLVGYYRVDEALPEQKLAVEMDGCYWHGCPVCGYAGRAENIKLDKRKQTYLMRHGWTVVRIREHELRDLDACVQKVKEALQNLGVSNGRRDANVNP